MLKSLKDVRRRASQSILVSVGSADITKDEIFEDHNEKFDRMILDMNECGAALYSFLNHQKALFSDAEELSKSMLRIFQMNKAINDWPDVKCRLNHTKEAEKYAEIISSIHNVVRSSSSTICCELGIDPLRAMVTKTGPEISTLKKERNIKLIDYDSYRRRLKEKEDKKTALETTGKGCSSAATEVDVEIEKFQKKVEKSFEEYMYLNEKVKSDIIDAKTHHDDLMDELLITTIVCQSELFFQAANELESIIERFPDHKVQLVRKKIHRLIKAGGIQPTSKAEKSALQKAVAIATGKAVSSDFNKKVEETTSTPVLTNMYIEVDHCSALSRNEQARINLINARSTVVLKKDNNNNNEFGNVDIVSSSSNPFLDTTNHILPTTPSNTINTIIGSNFHRALYDQVAEDDDEISFKVGDIIEVIEKIDDGWWKGKVSNDNKIGVFPSNYVIQI